MTTPHPKTRVDGRYKTLRIDLHNEIVELASRGTLTIIADTCVTAVTATLDNPARGIHLITCKDIAYDCDDNVVLPLVQCVIELRRQVEALKAKKPNG